MPRANTLAYFVIESMTEREKKFYETCHLSGERRAVVESDRALAVLLPVLPEALVLPHGVSRRMDHDAVAGFQIVLEISFIFGSVLVAAE
jgi:hypothetical protein